MEQWIFLGEEDALRTQNFKASLEETGFIWDRMLFRVYQFYQAANATTERLWVWQRDTRQEMGRKAYLELNQGPQSICKISQSAECKWRMTYSPWRCSSSEQWAGIRETGGFDSNQCRKSNTGSGKEMVSASQAGTAVRARSGFFHSVKKIQYEKTLKSLQIVFSRQGLQSRYWERYVQRK